MRSKENEDHKQLLEELMKIGYVTSTYCFSWEFNQSKVHNNNINALLLPSAEKLVKEFLIIYPTNKVVLDLNQSILSLKRFGRKSIARRCLSIPFYLLISYVVLILLKFRYSLYC
jgi:hypothetical protein